MEFLSLEREPEPPTQRFGRTEAIAASIAIHVLLLLMLLWLPSHLPERIRVLLEPRQPVVATRETDPSARESLTQPRVAEKKPPRIPLQFAYVKVPDDTPQKNPDAHLLSDKDRRARQEMPTPPDARLFSRDPHSVGDSIDRVKPDPRIAQGQDMPKPTEPQASQGPDRPAEGTGSTPKSARPATPGDEEAHIARAQDPPGELRPTSPDGTLPRTGEGGAPGSTQRESGSSGSRASTSHPSTDTKRPTEYKFSFNNQGWLKNFPPGTISFDTQGFDWGDYARQIYVIIRNNWLERIPLAAREGGLAGYTCQHFVIAKDGSVSNVDVTRASSIPPFNKAASDALHASSPLPPLPADFPDPQEGVTYCFFYNMYPGEAD